MGRTRPGAKPVSFDPEREIIEHYFHLGYTYDAGGGSRGRVQGVRTPPPEMKLSSAYTRIRF